MKLVSAYPYYPTYSQGFQTPVLPLLSLLHLSSWTNIGQQSWGQGGSPSVRVSIHYLTWWHTDRHGAEEVEIFTSESTGSRVRNHWAWLGLLKPQNSSSVTHFLQVHISLSFQIMPLLTDQAFKFMSLQEPL